MQIKISLKEEISLETNGIKQTNGWKFKPCVKVNKRKKNKSTAIVVIVKRLFW